MVQCGILEGAAAWHSNFVLSDLETPGLPRLIFVVGLISGLKEMYSSYSQLGADHGRSKQMNREKLG